MKEYIDREIALEIVKRTSGDYATAFCEIAHAEAADVVEVVRCKDCTMFTMERKAVGMYWDPPKNDEGWCNFFDSVVNKEDFCSNGERKEK